MDREQLLQQVSLLREEGRSIRAIGLELGAHRSRVQRALKTLALRRAEQSMAPAESGGASASGPFVGREREMGELIAALGDALSGRGRIVALVGEPGIWQDEAVTGAFSLRCPERRQRAMGAMLRGQRRASVLAVGADNSRLRPQL